MSSPVITICTTTFNIQKLCNVPTKYISLFVMDPEQTAAVYLRSINCLEFLRSLNVFTARYEFNL
jgi:hypothetical protein